MWCLETAICEIAIFEINVCAVMEYGRLDVLSIVNWTLGGFSITACHAC